MQNHYKWGCDLIARFRGFYYFCGKFKIANTRNGFQTF